MIRDGVLELRKGYQRAPGLKIGIGNWDNDQFIQIQNEWSVFIQRGRN